MGGCFETWQSLIINNQFLREAFTKKKAEFYEKVS